MGAGGRADSCLGVAKHSQANGGTTPALGLSPKEAKAFLSPPTLRQLTPFFFDYAQKRLSDKGGWGLQKQHYMSTQEFWNHINQIIVLDFTAEGLATLETYAKQFITGQLLFTRYTEDEQRGCAAGGTLHVIASILSGAEISPDQLTAPAGSFKREQQRAEAQTTTIERWARTIGCWIDNVDVVFNQLFGEQLAEGGEAHVYDNGPALVKRIGLDYYVLPMLALDRITLHNTLFPSTKMTVFGFGKTTAGDFQILVQQQFIHGTSVTEPEIQAYAQSLGFQLINPRNWTYATPDIYLSDLHDENLIKTPKATFSS